ncbi:MAG TPA: hypothetical protein VJ873_04865, partial [bacterium]|nr:hypothetical protein [bacterium]
ITNHLSYWVEPVDLTGHGGMAGAASTPALNLAPTPPSNPSVATPVGNNRITVSWGTGNAGFFGAPQDYVVYRVILPNPTSPTATPQAVATVPATQLSYTDVVAGFAPGTAVAYQVGLVDGAGNISDLVPSGNNVVLTGLTLPAAPTVVPFSGSVASIEFAWLNDPLADSVTAYSVFGPDLPTVTPMATPLVTVLPAPTMVFAPAPITWAATYYYLLAQNSKGASGAATLSGIAVPTYTVTAVIVPGSRQSQVSWNMVPAVPVSGTLTPGVDSYGIYRSTSSTVNFTPVATVQLGTNNYADALPAATAGVTYFYRVTARAGGASGQLAESPLVPNPDTYANVLAWPNPPSAFSALSGVTQTTLLWAVNAPQEGVTSYSVFQNGNSTPLTIISATQGPTPIYSFAVAETSGNQSSYSVAANNVGGPSDLSQAVSVLVPPAMTPVISLLPPPAYGAAATLT